MAGLSVVIHDCCGRVTFLSLLVRLKSGLLRLQCDFFFLPASHSSHSAVVDQSERLVRAGFGVDSGERGGGRPAAQNGVQASSIDPTARWVKCLGQARFAPTMGRQPEGF